MRKVLTIAVAALLVVAFVGAANAAAPSYNTWRVGIKADNGSGGGAAPACYLGIATNATDGNDYNGPVVVPGTDSDSKIPQDSTGTLRYVGSKLPGVDNLLFAPDIRSNKSPYDYPNKMKVWDLFIAAGPNANSDPVSNDPIRLQFVTTTLPPLGTDAQGRPIFFELKMIDNKGKAGAPTNGTKWQIPIPTSISTSNTVFWTMDTALDTNGVAWGNLPVVKASNNSYAAWMNAGYQMQFRVVPEPSSMLALGSGLAGLVGFAIRRRRA